MKWWIEGFPGLYFNDWVIISRLRRLFHDLSHAISTLCVIVNFREGWVALVERNVAPQFFTSALDDNESLASLPDRINPRGKSPGIFGQATQSRCVTSDYTRALFSFMGTQKLRNFTRCLLVTSCYRRSSVIITNLQSWYFNLNYSLRLKDYWYQE
jgi:hypothetical protein